MATMSPRRPQSQDAHGYRFPNAASLIDLNFSLGNIWNVFSTESSASTGASTITKVDGTPTPEHYKVVIDPGMTASMVACPCCSYRRIAPNSLETLSEDSSNGNSRNKSSSSNKSVDDDYALQGLSLLDREFDEEEQEEEDGMPGILASGVKYTPKRVVAEGLLHKKGTGKDWLGSTDWKLRYARLVLAQVDGYGKVDVPILMIYWFQSSETPSTVIMLDSTVVVPLDLEDKQAWNAFLFHVVHAKQGEEEEKQVTRTFTICSKAARDNWVYFMNQALLDYEKEKSRVKKQQQQQQQDQFASAAAAAASRGTNRFAMQIMGLSPSTSSKSTSSIRTVVAARDHKNNERNSTNIYSYNEQVECECMGLEVSIAPLSPTIHGCNNDSNSSSNPSRSPVPRPTSPASSASASSNSYYCTGSRPGTPPLSPRSVGNGIPKPSTSYATNR